MTNDLLAFTRRMSLRAAYVSTKDSVFGHFCSRHTGDVAHGFICSVSLLYIYTYSRSLNAIIFVTLNLLSCLIRSVSHVARCSHQVTPCDNHDHPKGHFITNDHPETARAEGQIVLQAKFFRIMVSKRVFYLPELIIFLIRHHQVMHTKFRQGTLSVPCVTSGYVPAVSNLSLLCN